MTVSLGSEDYYMNLNKLINMKAVDFTLDEIMNEMNDLAFKRKLFDNYKDEEVIKTSFLRGLSLGYIYGKLNRLSNGGVESIPYDFSINYYFDEKNKSFVSFDFKTNPNSLIPTNIHAIIGNNGTGKTRFLRDVINAALNDGKYVKSEFSSDEIKINLNFNMESGEDLFSGVLFISYSPFDKLYEFIDYEVKESDRSFKSKYIGIYNLEIDSSDKEFVSFENWQDKFDESINLIKKNRNKHFLFWKQAKYLSFIMKKIFLNFNDIELQDIERKLIVSQENMEFIEDTYNKLSKAFSIMSSGEKIVTLGVTALVAYVEEKTLVLFDEPELYLHPPLVSNYIRIISDIMTEKNGLAMVVTHSPIILQEIPNNCVYITDDSNYPQFVRPKSTTFGENVSVLTNGIFGLDIEKSGFYSYIENFFKRYKNLDKDKIIEFSNLDELGSEARFFINLLIETNYYSENEEE